MKKTILQAAKSLLIAIAFIIAANYSVAFASIWVGPTAAPPGNNAAAPINVSGVAQSKDGSIWIDGINSLGQTLYTSLIVNNGRVAVGTTTVPSSSKLGVNGDIAAGRYCDLNGLNCFNSSYVYNLSTTTGACSTSDYYDSGWVALQGAGLVTLNHNLGTTDTIVYMEYKGDAGSPGYNIGPNQINQMGYGYPSGYPYWTNKTATSISITKTSAGTDNHAGYVHIAMWRTGCAGGGSASIPDPLAAYKATKSRTAWPTYVYCQSGGDSQLFSLGHLYTPALLFNGSVYVSVLYILADQARVGFNSTGALVYTYDGNNGGTYTGTCPTQLNLNGSANIVQGV